MASAILKPATPSRRSSILPAFNAAESRTLDGPAWLESKRARALTRLEQLSFPSTEDEFWRYSKIADLNLEDFAPAQPSTTPASFNHGIEALVSVHIAGGADPVITGVAPSGLRVGPAGDDDPAADAFGSLTSSDDYFVTLNTAFASGVLVIDVAPDTDVNGPVVIVRDGSRVGDGALASGFPRTLIRMGERSSIEVIELVVTSESAPELIVPVTEAIVGDGARLHHANLQQVGAQSWHIARNFASLGAGSELRSFVVSLGGRYDRVRSDSVINGEGSFSEVQNVYFGSADQMHDVRTYQDHAAPRSVSKLVCKGAVGDQAASVYSGLIKVRKGAVKTDAQQTNYNIVLDEDAHADSVPNLDIEENDVRCSHASTVGPIDEDQRYYLESRGIAPIDAERLIVQGFFNDVLDTCPVPGAHGLFRRQVALALSKRIAGIDVH